MWRHDLICLHDSHVMNYYKAQKIILYTTTTLYNKKNTTHIYENTSLNCGNLRIVSRFCKDFLPCFNTSYQSLIPYTDDLGFPCVLHGWIGLANAKQTRRMNKQQIIWMYCAFYHVCNKMTTHINYTLNHHEFVCQNLN